MDFSIILKKSTKSASIEIFKVAFLVKSPIRFDPKNTPFYNQNLYCDIRNRAIPSIKKGLLCDNNPGKLIYLTKKCLYQLYIHVYAI
jgi:hypothetical protein